MRGPSLRVWLLLVSIAFAMLVVGGMALTGYVIVSDGMDASARQASLRATGAASLLFAERVAEAESIAASASASPGEIAQTALAQALRNMSESLVGAGIGTVQIALFGPDLKPLWSSADTAVKPALAAGRQEALATGQTVREPTPHYDLLSGLVSHAQLNPSVAHVPVVLPGDIKGVLDVVYLPTFEERTIDSIRLPMTILAVTAMLLMVVLMQTSMVWVLNLVDNLREAADSIDAGGLDQRLPDSGSNEIGALARSVNSLIERLQRRSDAQSRFVADASHELATPVAGIRGYTSILREWGADDPDVREEAIDAIDRESRRMSRLTGDLLNLLHADQGLVLKRERFDLNALVRQRLAATAGRWIDKDIEYLGPGDDPLTMVGDPDRVEDVISILLDNASKYTPTGGHVSVFTSRRREIVTISVSDTGQGIPAEDLPRVFDRFYRSEASRAAGEGGFGLGLAIAQSIVQSMGGEITAASEAGAGTTFTTRLPRGRL